MRVVTPIIETDIHLTLQDTAVLQEGFKRDYIREFGVDILLRRLIINKSRNCSVSLDTRKLDTDNRYPSLPILRTSTEEQKNSA